MWDPYVCHTHRYVVSGDCPKCKALESFPDLQPISAFGSPALQSMILETLAKRPTPFGGCPSCGRQTCVARSCATVKPEGDSQETKKQPPPNQEWCVGCTPDNCPGCGTGPAQPRKPYYKGPLRAGPNGGYGLGPINAVFTAESELCGDLVASLNTTPTGATTEGDALRVAECWNAFLGIENPSEYITKLKRDLEHTLSLLKSMNRKVEPR